jgi:pseudouridine synthase
MHPSNQVEKEYDVTYTTPLTKEHFEKMKRGIMNEGELLRIKSYIIHSPTEVTIILTQGHKREIKRLISTAGSSVKRLTRERIGKWELGNLPPGKYKEITN